MPEETRDPQRPHFHYSREERLSSLSHRARSVYEPKRGFLRRNPSLLITLVNVAVVLVLLFVASALTRGRGVTKEFLGYRVTTKAASFDDQIFVTIEMVCRQPRTTPVEVRVVIRPVDGEARQEMSDVLPAAKGEKRVIRGTLPADAATRNIIVEFFGEGEQYRTAVPVKEM